MSVETVLLLFFQRHQSLKTMRKLVATAAYGVIIVFISKPRRVCAVATAAEGMVIIFISKTRSHTQCRTKYSIMKPCTERYF